MTTELSDDPVEVYLHEIGKVPLLSAEQEVTLAQQIRGGEQACAALQRGPALPWTDRQALVEQVERGGKARDQLIQANLRLVVSIAKRYTAHSLSLMDLIQEGNIGLMRAVEKFDWSRGLKFSTYATWWIRQAITRALDDKGRAIRLPVHMNAAIAQVKRTAEQLEQQMQREPTPEEVAAAMGVSASRVRHMLAVAMHPISLEQPIGEGGESCVGDFVADARVDLPHDTAAAMLLREAIDAVLHQLSERERTIIQLRYGLKDGRHRTLEEIGRTFGITRERVRQIEAGALRKLRHPHLGKKLRGYL